MALIFQILTEHVNETSGRVAVEDQLGLVFAGTSLTPLRVAGMFSSVGEVCEGFTGVGGYELDDQERFGTKVAAGCGGDGVRFLSQNRIAEIEKEPPLDTHVGEALSLALRTPTRISNDGTCGRLPRPNILSVMGGGGSVRALLKQTTGSGQRTR